MQHLLSISALNPALIWGGLLVASPIIIHLLSKRRYRIIDWAAMDFLFDANRRNRRRIQLEHLILLILRCLAILLLAFLLARPVLKSTHLLGKAVGTYRIERIIVLDNSPSMGARGNRKTSFEEAKDGLIAFVRSIAAERPGDSVTLLTTSDPDRPLIAGVYANPDKAEEWAGMIGKLELSDLPAAYDRVLQSVSDTLRSSTTNVNRVLYVVTDLRQKDWLAGSADKSPLAAIIKDIRPRLENLLVVDLGGRRDANVGVVGLAPLSKSPVVGVPTRFQAMVRNFGDAEVSDVAVTFTAGDAAPLSARVPRIKPRSTEPVEFTFTFREAGALVAMAETEADDLPADNARYFAADVQKGVEVLVVDGEPSSEYGQSETFYLERALAPPGELRSGNLLQVITENQFETVPLDTVQAVVICNLYRMSEERITSLETYVKNGGGLIFFLGDQVDEAAYNGRLYRNGQGLFPVKLDRMEGDEAERTWALMSLKAVNHPVLRVFDGTDNPLLSRVKMFRWWSSVMPEGASASPGAPSVLASLISAKGEPLILEKPFGKGRVLAVMSSADVEWSTWPQEPSFLVCANEMLSHVARPTSGDRQLTLASPLRHLLNINRYESQVTITPPIKARATQLRGVAAEDGKGLLVEYDDTRQRGFYRIGATRRDGKPEQFAYAANIDPEEGDLRRADSNEIKRRLGDTPVEFAAGLDQFRSAAEPSQGEIWRSLLVMMAVVLGVEQFLGWWFGQRR
jgi:hypothetical protein